MTGGLHLVKSYGRCDGSGSSLQAEAVGMPSILLFIALKANTEKIQTSKSCMYLITWNSSTETKNT